MTGTYVLRNVMLLGERRADVTIRKGRFASVADAGDEDATPDEGVVECSGLVLLPGLVDLHTHLRDPGPEQPDDVTTGVVAGAHGGYTALCAMANTDPVGDNPQVLEAVAQRAKDLNICDVFPVGAVTRGLEGNVVADIESLAASRVDVRMFSDDGFCVSRADVLDEALRRVAAVGGVLAQHAQDPRLTRGSQLNDGIVSRTLGLVGWPRVAEEAVIARDVVMAQAAGCRLHVCHVSTSGSVEVLRWAKTQGWPVTAEVTPHHLLLTDQEAQGLDPVYKVNPPLRTQDDVTALRSALADGTIDAVATDHAPHPATAKQKPWEQAPMGMLGLETALPVMATALGIPRSASWRTVADRMSTAPARIAGRAEEHGRPIAEGEPANWCLVDARGGWSVDAGRLVTRSRNTPFADRRFTARVVATALRGAVTFDADGRFTRTARVEAAAP